MGRRSRRKRKRSKNQRRKDDRYGDGTLWPPEPPPPPPRGAPATRKFRVRVEVDELEVAKGHDGLLRGMPEPVVVVAAWLVDALGALLVGRSTVRFQTPTTFPCALPVPEKTRLDARLRGDEGSVVLVLACGVEEDNGRGVQEAYAAMERSAELALMWSEGDHPHGGPLDEFARSASSGLRSPRPVEVELDRRALQEHVAGDDWIAAAACVAPCSEPGRRTLRFPLRADDGKNDWTLCASVTVKS